MYVFIYDLICGLFDGAVSITLNDRMINEFGKDMEVVVT
jgi:hypothetical protein